MENYQVPVGKSYRNWQEVFENARSLPCTGFNTGQIYGALKNNSQAESFPTHRDPDERYDYAVMVFHFRHPEQGDILIDTGFDSSYRERPPHGNLSATMKIYSKLLNVRYAQSEEGLDLGSQLQKQGINPSHVFLTHLHADHTGGLPSLPSHVPVSFGKEESTLMARLLCGNHFKGKARILHLDLKKADGLDPFSHVLDLFGDGTFWAISTPGHTRGHISYLINTAPSPIFIAGDAELTTWAMEEKILVSTVDGTRGKLDVEESAKMIRSFHRTYPQTQIRFSHDEKNL